MTTMTLGDVVTGNYQGVAFEGVLSGYDDRGWVYVDFAQSVVILNVARTGIALDRSQRTTLRATGRKVDGVVTERDSAVLGGSFFTVAS